MTGIVTDSIFQVGAQSDATSEFGRVTLMTGSSRHQVTVGSFPDLTVTEPATREGDECV